MAALWLLIEEVLVAVHERRRSWWPTVLAVVVGACALAILGAVAVGW